MSDDPEPRDQRPSGWTFALWGAAWTGGGLIVTVLAQVGLFRLWLDAQNVRPDFDTNGLNWLSIAMVTLIPVLDLVILAVPFVLMTPLIVQGYEAKGTRIPVGWFTTGIVTGVALVYALFIGVGGDHLLLPLTAAPPMAVLGFGMTALLDWANVELGHGRRSARTPR